MKWIHNSIKPTESDYYRGSVLAICKNSFPCLVSYKDEYDEWQDDSCIPQEIEVWTRIEPPEGLFNGRD